MLDLLVGNFGWNGLLWGTIVQINDHLGSIGAIVVSVFVASWLASALVYRRNRYSQESDS